MCKTLIEKIIKNLQKLGASPVYLFTFLRRKHSKRSLFINYGLCVHFQFPLNNFSLLWPIDTKLAVWVAYIKTQLGIATQVSVIKVKVTVTKNRYSVLAQ